MELNSVTGGDETTTDSHENDFLLSINAFIEEDDVVLDEVEADPEGPGDFADISNVPSDSENRVHKKIHETNNTLKKDSKEFDNLTKKRKKIDNQLNRADKMIKQIKAKVQEFKSNRKTSGDGIETEMFTYLKVVHKIQLPAYHGGKLIGKDCQKIMENADQIFKRFATIMKAKKRDHCTYEETEIDAFCDKYANLCMLWDGAFSYAS